ncbi:MAG: ABC transporter ATP-binding protein [Clostridia bacterium]|nr:ABC transporter ATP-binding protein [Clostridia bacterium]
MIKRFAKYYKPHMALFIVDFTCAFIVSCMDLVFPLVVKWVIDDVLPSKNMRLLIWIGIGLLGLYILRYVFDYIVTYWGHVLGTRIEYDMREQLFSHIQKLSFTYFDNTKTGHIMSRIVNDLFEIAELAHHGPEDLFTAGVTLTGSFVIMMLLNWKLALITFALVPFMTIFAIKKNKQLQQVFRDLRIKIADINAQVEDSISGVREVKSFTNEGYEQDKFREGNTNYKEARQKGYKVMGQFFPGINLYSNLINLVVLVFGGIFIYYDQLSPGDLMGFLLFVSMFLQPVRKISVLLENYQKGMAGFARFVEIIDMHPDITDRKNAKRVGRLEGDIEFKDVTFSYNNKKNVLENLSFTIKKGQTVAIVGPSGGGKTTLCSLIPRFYEIDRGKIEIGGIDIRDVTQKSLRKNIGLVQQNVFLFSGTVKENIAYGKLDATDGEIVQAAKNANAHDFIMSLENGYDTYVGERGVKLSGGQKQRIAIARIFLKNPPILILDEATSALDNQTERMIQHSLNRLSQERTTLVIAHRLATVVNADRIIVLTDQGIVEQGTHRELMEKAGLYSHLYNMQFQDITQQDF